MTEAQKEIYELTKARLRRLGYENPADVIVALAEEVEFYRHKIKRLEDRNELLAQLFTAQWIPRNSTSPTALKCSACEGKAWADPADDIPKATPFCPNCGAKMTNWEDFDYGP